MGYVRVSTARQGEEGLSLEAQEERIRLWCQQNGQELIAIHSDAISGKAAENRPGLQKALKLCDQGYDLVIYSLSRMSRSTLDAIQIDERIRRGGGKIVSLSEHIDTSTASGRLMYKILAAVAEYDREVIVERTEAVIGYKKTHRHRTGKIPYGYQLGPDEKTLIPDPQEQENLTVMRELSESGLSYRKLSAALVSRNIVSRQGNPFGVSTLQAILTQT